MCDFCLSREGRSLGHTRQVDPDVTPYANHSIMFRRGKAYLSLQLAYCGNSVEVKTQIYFCPMCGRELKKEE